MRLAIHGRICSRRLESEEADASEGRPYRETAMAVRAKKRAKAGYMISAVAELYKLHPQTLRLYERVGLL